MINVCDGARARELDLDEEGVIVSPGLGRLLSPGGRGLDAVPGDPAAAAAAAAQGCAVLLTPVHGQFLHLDLIPLSTEDTTDQGTEKDTALSTEDTDLSTEDSGQSTEERTDQDSARDTERSCASAAAVRVASSPGRTLRLCPGSAADRAALQASLFPNASVSLEKNPVNQSDAEKPSSAFLLFYKGEKAFCLAMASSHIFLKHLSLESAIGMAHTLPCFSPFNDH